MSGFGNTPKDSTNIPLGSVAVPGTSNGDLTALQGGPASTDSNSNSSAPVSTYVYSGNFVDFGQTTSSAATTDTGTFTFMAFVKRMLQKLTSLVTNTSAFVDAATTGATLQTVNDTTVLANVGAQGTWQIEIIPNSAFVGTIIFEGLSLDATTWGTMTGHLAGSSSMASSSTFTGTGNVTQIWRGNSSTYKQVRARLSTVSASNAVVYVGLSAAPYAISITNQIQTNLDQVNGTALSSSNPVPTLDTNSAAAATVLGGVADAAATDTTSSWSIKALLAGMFGSLRTLAAAVTSNIIQVKLNSGTANVGNIVVQTVSGTALQADQSNTELKTSIYGKQTTAGDTAIAADASGFMRTNTSSKAGYIALSSPPANTNAGSDTTLTFSQQVNRFFVQNLTAVTVYMELDTAAGLISVALLPGGVWTDPIQVTAIHLYTATAQPINAAGGIIVRGWV